MQYNFDKRVDRSNMASIRELKTPETVAQRDFISCWGAEFEFETAPCVTNAIVEWAKKGLAAYNVPDDTLYSAIQNWMKMHRGWEIQKEWIVPTYGLTCSVATICRAFTEEGDGIIGFDPVYHVTWDPVKLNGRRHVNCQLLFDGATYHIDYEALEELCKDPKNKVITFCNPHNPTGKVWGKRDLEKVAQLALKYDKILYSDEIFADLVYEGVEMLTFNQITDAPLKVIVSTSLGKTFSMTGIGQANLIISHEELREQFIAQREIDYYGSFNPMMRAAYLGGYTEEGSKWARAMMRYCHETYCQLDQYFKAYLPKMKAIPPEGTFILWVDCRELGFSTDEEMEKVFQKAGFSCDFGSQYGSEPGFIRMNLAAPRADIFTIMESLRETLAGIL